MDIPRKVRERKEKAKVKAKVKEKAKEKEKEKERVSQEEEARFRSFRRYRSSVGMLSRARLALRVEIGVHISTTRRSSIRVEITSDTKRQRKTLKERSTEPGRDPTYWPDEPWQEG